MLLVYLFVLISLLSSPVLTSSFNLLAALSDTSLCVCETLCRLLQQHFLSQFSIDIFTYHMPWLKATLFYC